MATAELVIAFGARLDGLESSLKRVNTQLSQMEQTVKASSTRIQQSADNAGSGWLAAASSLRQFATAALVVQGLRIGTRMLADADDLNASFNRMRIQLGGLTSLTQSTFGALQRVAAATGQPFAQVTEQFTRFQVALSSSPIAATNAQLIQLVETLQRFAQLTAGQAGANAITQLAQGLASGRLQGDELRSIMENMPLLAQELARALGVSTGELRKMGEEGRLTAQNVFPALLQAGRNIESQLRSVPLTLRQMFTTAMSSTIAMIRQVDQVAGASTFLSMMMATWSSTMNNIRVQTGGATPQEEIAQLDNQIRDRERRVADLRRQIEETPQPGMSPGYRPEMRRLQRITALEQDLAREEDVLRRAIDRRAAIQYQADEDRESSDSDSRSRARANAERGFEIELESARRHSVDAYRIRQESHDRIRQLNERYAAMPDASRTRERQAERDAAIAAIRADADREIAALTSADRNRAAAEDRADLQRIQRMEARRQRMMALVQRHSEPIVAYRQEVASSLEGLRDLFASSGYQAEAMAIAVGLVGEQTRTLFQNMQERGRAPAQALSAINDEIVRIADSLSNNPAFNRQTFIEQATDAAGRSLDRLRIKFQSWQDLARDGIQKFSSAAADAIVDFATGASQNFTKMAEDFAKSIAKMILNAMIFRAIMLGLRAVGIDLTIPTRGLQSGGPVTAGEAVIVGEKRPEVFVPSSSGYVHPMVDGFGGGGTTVNVYNNAPGTRARVQEKDNGFGAKDIEIFIEEVVGRGIVQGRYDQAMQASYGAFRLGRV